MDIWAVPFWEFTTGKTKGLPLMNRDKCGLGNGQSARVSHGPSGGRIFIKGDDRVTRPLIAQSAGAQRQGTIAKKSGAMKAPEKF